MSLTLNNKPLFLNCSNIIISYFDPENLLNVRACSRFCKETADKMMGVALDRWLPTFDSEERFEKLQRFMSFAIVCKREAWVAKICTVYWKFSIEPPMYGYKIAVPAICRLVPREIKEIRFMNGVSKRETRNDNTVLAPLHLAIAIGYIPTVVTIIQSECVTNARKEVFNFVLATTFWNGSYTSGVEKGTPLFMACTERQHGVAKALLEHNAAAYIKEVPKGSSPLHEAIRKGDKVMAALLLEYNADVNVREWASEPTAREFDKNGILGLGCQCLIS